MSGKRSRPPARGQPQDLAVNAAGELQAPGKLLGNIGESPVLVLLQELIIALMQKVEKLEEFILELTNKLLGGVPFEDKEYYTPKELAKMKGLKVETIREYLKEGRIEGSRSKSGRGGIPEWRIHREEAKRYLDVGLREPSFRYRHPR